MTTTHTPGPWIAAESDSSFTVAPASSDSTVIAEVGTTARNGTMARAKASKANAILIASAPDMLEALKLAYAIMPQTGNNVAAHVYYTIVKAEGKA